MPLPPHKGHYLPPTVATFCGLRDKDLQQSFQVSEEVWLIKSNIETSLYGTFTFHRFVQQNWALQLYIPCISGQWGNEDGRVTNINQLSQQIPQNQHTEGVVNI